MTHSERPEIPPQDKPRKFHEVFMLRAAEQGEGMQPKVSIVGAWALTKPDPFTVTDEQYAIFSQNFRFIG